MNYPVVNSHDSWSKLEEVWLGDVYPASWYDHLDSEIRDCFYELTERTQQDLKVIEKTLQSFGVRVCRPVYDTIDNFLDATETLIKPEITPRDYYVTIGNTLFASYPESWTKSNPWQQHLDRYQAQDTNCVANMLQNDLIHVHGACTVRVGRDLFLDLGSQNTDNKSQLVDSFKQDFLHRFPHNRINVLFNGGHLDGCFAVLKPGLILASSYFTEYERTFPGWTVINCDRPEFADHKKYRKGPSGNDKWWLPAVNRRAFNRLVVDHAKNWIGDYTETFFEINCLVIDEKNVIVLGENEKIQKEIESHGITTHSVPFRTRTFWDGGMHCLTVDIRRQSQWQDFFPAKSAENLLVHI